MTSAFITYAALIFLTAVGGGALPLMVKAHREEGLKVFVCLGAGLLLGMAFLHMLPESAELLEHGKFGAWFLLGFLLLLVLERFFMVHPCDEHGCHYHTIGLAAFAGLTVHGVIEGLALASSLYISSLAPLVLIAVLAHKAPTGFALTSILRLAQWRTSSILLFLVGVALSVPLGMLLAYYFLHNEKIPGAAGALLAMSAGTFVYIGACDLLPELHRSDTGKFKRLGAFLGGLGLSFLSGFLLGH